VIGSSASWREGRKGRNRSLIWTIELLNYWRVWGLRSWWK
jgi:hypothetical protein